MKKKLPLVAVASLSIFLVGCSYQKTFNIGAEQPTPGQDVNQNLPVIENNQNAEQPDAPVDGYQGWNSFSSPNGGYSFKYSTVWNAAVNKYNVHNSLFGVGATSQSGKGGVEVSDYTGTLEEYLNFLEQNTGTNYLARENVTINGIAAIRTKQEGSPVSGYSVLLKKGDQVFKIYINSQEADDVELFDKLAESFKFSN